MDAHKHVVIYGSAFVLIDSVQQDSGSDQRLKGSAPAKRGNPFYKGLVDFEENTKRILKTNSARVQLGPYLSA